MKNDILMNGASPLKSNHSSSARKQKEKYLYLDLNNARTTFLYHF
jgi:hypothetical protein